MEPNIIAREPKGKGHSWYGTVRIFRITPGTLTGTMTLNVNPVDNPLFFKRIFGEAAYRSALDIYIGNAADGDSWKEPAMYGAGAETCPECNGEQNNFSCCDNCEYEHFVCFNCHGLGVVPVKGE